MDALANLDLSQLPEATALRAEKYRRSYSEYLRAAWHVVEPGTEFMPNWHIDLIAEYLQAVQLRQFRFLAINMPPRYLKTGCVSVFWPTWTWTWEPESRWIFASYDQSLSTDISTTRRTVIESEWYQGHFGHIVRMAKDENLKGEFSNDRRGRMVSTSIGAKVLGKGGNFIVIDDPIDPERAYSRAYRDQATRFIRQTLYSRLNDKRRGVMVMVMQRLHVDDPTAMLVQEMGWTLLKIPAIAPKPQQYSFPISGKILHRQAGDILWPEREGEEELALMRKTLTEYGWASQYQQEPVPVGGAMVKFEWIRYYDVLPLRFDEVISTWDLTFTDTSRSDYVVGQVWGRLGATKYLLDQLRDRMGFTKAKAAMRAIKEKWPQMRAMYIEEKANGHATIEDMRKETSGVLGYDPKDRDKITRLAANLTEFESGCVLMPKPELQPWVTGYVERLCAFPSVDFDDEIDCTSMALEKMQKQQRQRDAFPTGVEKEVDRDSLRDEAFLGA